MAWGLFTVLLFQVFYIFESFQNKKLWGKNPHKYICKFVRDIPITKHIGNDLYSINTFFKNYNMNFIQTVQNQKHSVGCFIFTKSII